MMSAIGRFGLPVLEAPHEPELAPYWQAAAAGRLVLPRCRRCAFTIWYPRTFCPSCHHPEVDWVEASGRGVVYSFTVTRHRPGRYRDVESFVLAYVELDEGPRVLTNIVECAPERVHISMPVAAVFDPVPDGAALLRFAPVQPIS